MLISYELKLNLPMRNSTARVVAGARMSPRGGARLALTLSRTRGVATQHWQRAAFAVAPGQTPSGPAPASGATPGAWTLLSTRHLSSAQLPPTTGDSSTAVQHGGGGVVGGPEGLPPCPACGTPLTPTWPAALLATAVRGLSPPGMRAARLPHKAGVSPHDVAPNTALTFALCLWFTPPDAAWSRRGGAAEAHAAHPVVLHLQGACWTQALRRARTHTAPDSARQNRPSPLL